LRKTNSFKKVLKVLKGKRRRRKLTILTLSGLKRTYKLSQKLTMKLTKFKKKDRKINPMMESALIQTKKNISIPIHAVKTMVKMRFNTSNLK
jgi:hypothetical protein